MFFYTQACQRVFSDNFIFACYYLYIHTLYKGFYDKIKTHRTNKKINTN